MTRPIRTWEKDSSFGFVSPETRRSSGLRGLRLERRGKGSQEEKTLKKFLGRQKAKKNVHFPAGLVEGGNKRKKLKGKKKNLKTFFNPGRHCHGCEGKVTQRSAQKNIPLKSSDLKKHT